MAKKNVEKTSSEMSIEERLKNLYQLQTILTEIDNIRTIRGELPLEVQDLEDEVEGLHTRIEKTRSEAEEISKAIVALRGEIEESKMKIDNYQQQIDNVRNSREYDLINKEIEFKNLEIQLAEKKINEAKVAEARKQELIQKSEEELDNRTQDLELKKNELDEIVIETKADEDKLREKAKALELTIEPRILHAFKRIRKNSRNGLGIVYVQRDACGGCFAKIPPQRQLDVRMRKKVIVCEYCGRILIDPELAGVIPDAPKEEKPRRRRTSRKRTAVEEESGE
jgi:predicted  nucleic acid-binding Zn-ribbon protein